MNLSVEFSKNIVVFIIFGYFSMGRSFSYIGIPPIYMDQIIILAFFLLNINGFRKGLYLKLRKADVLLYLLYSSIAFGMISFYIGVEEGATLINAFRTLSYLVYPLFVYLGVSAASNISLLDFRRSIAAILNMSLIYYVLYILCAYNFIESPKIPFSSIELIGVPTFAYFMPILTIFIYSKKIDFYLIVRLSSFIGIILLNLGRASLISLLLGVIAFVRFTNSTVKISISLLLIMLVFSAFGSLIPGLAERAGSLNPVFAASRIVATFSPQMATNMLESSGSDYAEASAYTEMVNGTANWRQSHWEEISLRYTDGSLLNKLFGSGAGIPIATLDDGSNLFSPHNIFFYVLNYSGAVGLLAFFAVNCVIFLKILKISNYEIRRLGLSFWLGAAVMSAFGNFLEVPFGAVPTYFFIGILISVGSRNSAKSL